MIKFNLYKEGGLKVHFVKKDGELPEEIKEYLEKKKFSYKFKESLYLPSFLEESEIFMGLGEDELNLEDVRNLFFELGNILRENQEHEVEIKMPDLSMCNRKTIMAAYEGLRQGEYEFTKKTDVKEKKG